MTNSKNFRLLVAIFGALAIISTVRLWTDQDGLTSSGTIGTALRLTVPILLAGMAGLWAERCGVLNIGIEGMMIFGTWAGAWGAWQFGPWVGLLFAVLGGMFGGLVHSIATVRFNIDQVISGVVINLFAFFGVRYLSELVYVGKKGGGISQSPPQKWALPRFDLPILSGGEIAGWKSPDFLGWLELQRWFIIGDLGGIGRGLTHNISWATVIALVVVPVSTWVLWRTRFGLRLRSSGESPVAAESLGVDVIRLRYYGLLISGGLAGLAGGTLSIVASSYYRQGQTAGRGFIGLATMIFGNWRPSGIMTGAMLFGYAEGIKLVASDSITALFLFIAAISGVFLIYAIIRRKRIQVLIALVAFCLSALAYQTVDTVPESLTQSLPYVVTLIVLATANQRLRPPAMAGVPFRRGEPH